jgi:outer membrane protein
MVGRTVIRFFSILGAAALVFGASGVQAESKVAVVDTQRAIMETEDGLRAQATLKKLFDSRQRELDKKQVDLQKQREDIEKQRDVLGKDALQKRIETWQRDMMQLQAVYVDYNKELQKKQNEITQPIFEKTLALVRRMASTEGIDVVLDKQAVAYVRGDLDLTDRVIGLYNRGATEAPAEGGAKPVPPKAPDAPKP